MGVGLLYCSGLNPFNTTLFIASAQPDTALLTKVTMLCTVFFHTKKNITQFAVCTVFNLDFLWEDIIFLKNFVLAICSIWNDLSYDVKFVYIILILFARFLAEKKILLFLFGISVSRKTTRFSTCFSSRKVCKNFSENITVFIIGFFFHLYHNRNLFCWKILSVLKVFSYHGHFDQHKWVQARPPCTPKPTALNGWRARSS